MSILPPKHAAVRVRLTTADRDVLVKRAQQSGVALSVIIRRAIRLYLNQAPAMSTPVDKPAYRAIPTSSDGRGGA